MRPSTWPSGSWIRTGLCLCGASTPTKATITRRGMTADLAAIADQAQRQMLDAAQAIRDATGAACEVSMGSTPSLFARSVPCGHR